MGVWPLARLLHCHRTKVSAARRHWSSSGDERQEEQSVNIRQQAQVPDMTLENFERLVINSSIPALVNFQTPWSRRMEPMLGQLAEAFAGRLRVVQVNISATPELAARFKVRAVPTLLIFKKGVPVEF